MAINVNRADRNSHKIFTKPFPPENVGPGTYLTEVHAQHVEERGAPFESLQEKDAYGTRPMVTPGPGSYMGQPDAAKAAEADVNNDGRGTNNFISTSNRLGPIAPGSSAFLPSTILENPGPGTHNISTEWISPKKLMPERAPPILTMCPSRPSIPQTRSTMSTADASETAFQCKYTGEKEDKVGPFEYTPAGEHVVGPQRPIAKQWRVCTTQRDLNMPSVKYENSLPSRINPGPGAYESQGTLVQDTSKETSAFASTTPMVHQKVSKDGQQPGPGAYLKVEKVKTKGLPPKSNNQFGSTIDRVGWSRLQSCPFTDPYNQGPEVVGPGHYADPNIGRGRPSSSPPIKQKLYGVHHPSHIMMLQESSEPVPAFSSTADRWKKRDADTLGPGQYNHTESMDCSMGSRLKQRAAVGKMGVFGSRNDRFHRSAFTPKTDTIDPGRYDMFVHGRCDEAPRSMFQSTSERFESSTEPAERPERMIRPSPPLPKKQPTPGPGSYNHRHVETVNYRSPFRHPRNEHVTFGTATDRFDLTAPGRLEPGPGEYQPGVRRTRSLPGFAQVRSNRNLTAPANSTKPDLGPGSYEVTSSLLKKTFNVSTETTYGVSMRSTSSVRLGSTR